MRNGTDERGGETIVNELKQTPTKTSLPINFIVTFLCFVDTPLLIPILALYAASLEVSVEKIGLIIGLYSLTHIPANILLGRLIDRFGYKTPLILGLLFDAISMFGYSVARTPLTLALLRSFHGIVGGAAGPATMSVAAHHTAATRKGRGMGFYGMAIGGATLVGYGVSGVLASRFGYHMVFYVGFGLLLIGLLLALTMPASPPATTTRVKTSPREQFQHVFHIIRRRELLIAYGAIFAQYFGFGGIATLLPLLVQKLGMAAFQVGMLMATFAAVFVLFMYPSGLLSDRAGRRLPVIIGLSLNIICIVLLSVQQSLAPMIVIMAFYGIGYAFLFPSITALVAQHSAPEERGIATGIFHSLLTAGVAIGAPVLGGVARLVGIELGLAISASAAALVLLFVLTVLRR